MANASIRVSFDPASNLNDESERQYTKESSPSNDNEGGRQMDFKDDKKENDHEVI
jgi:hypothetical protein